MRLLLSLARNQNRMRGDVRKGCTEERLCPSAFPRCLSLRSRLSQTPKRDHIIPPFRFVNGAPKETQRETKDNLSQRGSPLPTRTLDRKGGGGRREMTAAGTATGDEARGDPIRPELSFPHFSCICRISLSEADASQTRHSGEGAHGDTTPLAISLLFLLFECSIPILGGGWSFSHIFILARALGHVVLS